MSTSPLSGQELAREPSFQNDIRWFTGEPIGQWGATDYVIDSLGLFEDYPLQTRDLKLTLKQLRQVRAMIAAKAAEARFSDSRPPLIMTNEGRENYAKRGELNGDELGVWRVWTIEDLWSEASNLSLETKALRTLLNLINGEESPGEGLPLSFSFGPYPGWIGPEREGFIAPFGLVYGCQEAEAPIAMQWLLERDLIASGNSVMIGTMIHVTPKGYAVGEQLQRGNPNITRSGFLICRFVDEIDAIYDSVYKPTGEHPELLCPIHRVKDVHHVDRIDDRILQEISSATVVVVDLTDQNFNVAFEAGFALALGKPIVWTMRRQSGELKLPFDIQSQNILIWDAEKLDEFRESLKLRLLAALSKAAQAQQFRL